MHLTRGLLRGVAGYDVPNIVPAAGGGTSLLLDGISGITAAYALRKLRTAYAGNCLQVKRASDNSTLDVGFVSNALDSASIATFIAATTGSISKWYDQSGNGIDLTGTTHQSYVASGMNSLPSISFDGAGVMLSSAVTMATLFGADPSTQATIMMVLSQVGTNSQNAALGVSNVATEIYPTFGDTIYFDFGSSSGTGRVNVAEPAAWDDVGHVVEVYRDTSGNQPIIVDGATLTTGTSLSATPTGTNQLIVGGDAVQSNGQDGYINELIVAGAALSSANRTIIRKTGVGSGAGQKSMGTYYGITVS